MHASSSFCTSSQETFTYDSSMTSRSYMLANFHQSLVICNLDQLYQVSYQNNEVDDHDKLSKLSLINSLEKDLKTFPNCIDVVTRWHLTTSSFL